MKYKTKQIEIEAFKFDFNSDIPDWFFRVKGTTNINIIAPGKRYSEIASVYESEPKLSVTIDLGNKVLHANRGDYIIKKADGEIAVLSKALFEETYEEISDNLQAKCSQCSARESVNQKEDSHV